MHLRRHWTAFLAVVAGFAVVGAYEPRIRDRRWRSGPGGRGAPSSCSVP
jgi:hypothetical protein